jgi:hypothetical protein
MISFRVRPVDSIEWHSASFDGEHEDILAHLFSVFLLENSWEGQAAYGHEDFEEIDWEEE